MFFPISDWFAAFVLTLAVELPIAVLALRPAEPQVLRLVALVVYANLATHVAVWYVFSQLLEVGSVGYAVVAEGWAFGAEALFYAVAIRGLSARRAVAVAFAANAASFAVGRLIGRQWLGLVA
jgi:hypothetical protein